MGGILGLSVKQGSGVFKGGGALGDAVSQHHDAKKFSLTLNNREFG